MLDASSYVRFSPFKSRMAGLGVDFYQQFHEVRYLALSLRAFAASD